MNRILSKNHVRIFKYINSNFLLENIVENNKWHDNENVLIHTHKVYENMKKIFKNNKNKLSKYLSQKIGNYSKQELLLVASILHDIGKSKSFFINKNITNCHGHEKESAKYSYDILQHFMYSNQEIKYIQNIIRNHSEINRILNKSNTIFFSLNFCKFKIIRKKILLELCLHTLADIIDGSYKKNETNDYKKRILFIKKIINKLYFIKLNI